MYAVKEIFYTLQGEGANAGAPPSFAALPAAICGPAARRIAPPRPAASATTDFVGVTGDGGGRFRTAAELAEACRASAEGTGCDFIVLTGGEPMLQVDDALIEALHAAGFTIAIETNGTLPVPRAIDWICVSPKAGADLQQRSRRRIEARFSAGGPRPRGPAGAGFLTSLPAADGRPRCGG